ncbi:MAG: hypothetical protein IMX00_04895 [Limnochordales bacterium]|nr:hypothetical protein [Limnochordales bacterium]
MDFWDILSILVGACVFSWLMAWWQHAKNGLPWPEAIRLGIIQATGWALFFTFFQLLLLPTGHSMFD